MAMVSQGVSLSGVCGESEGVEPGPVTARTPHRSCWSASPIDPAQMLASAHRSIAHTVVDLGSDEFTVGRLHPMIDNDLRIRRLRQEAADPKVGLILRAEKKPF